MDGLLQPWKCHGSRSAVLGQLCRCPRGKLWCLAAASGLRTVLHFLHFPQQSCLSRLTCCYQGGCTALRDDFQHLVLASSLLPSCSFTFIGQERPLCSSLMSCDAGHGTSLGEVRLEDAAVRKSVLI